MYKVYFHIRCIRRIYTCQSLTILPFYQQELLVLLQVIQLVVTGGVSALYCTKCELVDHLSTLVQGTKLR